LIAFSGLAIAQPAEALPIAGGAVARDVPGAKELPDPNMTYKVSSIWRQPRELSAQKRRANRPGISSNLILPATGCAAIEGCTYLP